MSRRTRFGSANTRLPPLREASTCPATREKLGSKSRSGARADDMTDPVIEEYSRVAAEYDRRWSFYVQTTVRETMARLTLRPGERVLEVGCGTGALLEQILKACPDCRLAGIDPVPEMLTIARPRLPQSVDLREGW